MTNRILDTQRASNGNGILDTQVPSSSTDVNCSAATLTETGLSATVQQPTVVNATLGQIALSGNHASIPINVNCSVGSITEAGLSATVINSNVVNCALGSLTSAGLTADIIVPTVVNCGLGLETAYGLTASVVNGDQNPCIFTVSDYAMHTMTITEQP